MEKIEMYSKRLDKTFELEVCEPLPGQIVGDGSDITIVRASALENLLIDELAGAVTYTVTNRNDGAIIVEINDDTGVHVVGIGDIASRSLTNDIARKFPVSTAYSRAIASAVIKYLGFEGRVYSDASFEIEKETAEINTSVTSTTLETTSSSEVTDEIIAEDDVVIDEAPTEETIEEKETIWPFGKFKGKTLSYLAENEKQYLEFVYEQGFLKNPLKAEVEKIIGK